MKFTNRRSALAFAVAALGAAAAIGALAAASAPTSRRALLAGLQVPARPASPGFYTARHPAHGVLVAVALGPNRAAVPNVISARIDERGRPLIGARVTVSFSMPSMDMWRAYTKSLSADGGGRYTASIPVLGMTGRWQLRIDVAPPRGRAFRVDVSDRLSA
jgi:hypothetical protein